MTEQEITKIVLDHIRKCGPIGTANKAKQLAKVIHAALKTREPVATPRPQNKVVKNQVREPYVKPEKIESSWQQQFGDEDGIS